MKRIAIIILILYSGIVSANPVILPPVISEFSFNGGNWQMEVYLDEDIFGDFVWFSNFSELCLVCDASVTFFKPGIPFYLDSIYVIDQSWLTSTFKVDSLEDCINLHTWNGSSHFPIGESVFYSSTSTSHPPAGMGESIALQYIYSSFGYFDNVYQMIQSPPTFGTNPFTVDARCSFSGYVFDQFGNPVEGVEFVYCNEGHCYGSYQPSFPCFKTDTNGYFECDGLYPRLHNFQLTLDDYIYLSDQIFFDPQEPVYREYTLIDVGIGNKNLTSDIEIKVAPNPFHNRTRFSLDIPEELSWNDAKIIIRNINGQVVDFIPLTMNPWAGEDISVSWNSGNLPGGLYIYSLVVDGQVMNSGKLISH